MVEFFLNEQSLTLFSRGNFTEISMISYVCIHTEFYWNCFFRTNSCFDKISDQTFLNQPALLHLWKTLWKLFSDCKLSLSRGSVGPEGNPHPSNPRNLSALCTPNSTQQNNFNSCTDVVWTLPTPRVCECRSDGSGLCHCWEGGDPQTHTTIISVCGNPQLSSPWALFPLLYVLEADCSYLI